VNDPFLIRAATRQDEAVLLYERGGFAAEIVESAKVL